MALRGLATETWHTDFSPKDFLGRVRLEQLLERNATYNEGLIHDAKSACILCDEVGGRGILLNDRSFLCVDCYSEVALISYPEQYEALRRKHVLAMESRKLAREAFVQKFEYLSQGSNFVLYGWTSLLLMFAHPGFLALTVTLLAIGYAKNSANEKALGEWVCRRDEWDKKNPEPIEPDLRHFHDPAAVLSERDHAVLKIFNHWPGYPPFWRYLRAVVLAKDNGRCQVTGCPSRLELHVHHMKAVSEGGTHAPSNLVSLCDFHHALEPEKGHERIWGDIKTRYFTLVCAHERSNSVSLGTHLVRPHLRRLELVTLPELIELKTSFGLSCPNCHDDDLHIEVLRQRSVVRVICTTCSKATEGPQQLTEETGPLLAEILTATRNRGRWAARWDMLAERRAATWGVWTSEKISEKRRRHKAKLESFKGTPTCDRCGSLMRRIEPRTGDKWKAFWGCTSYAVTGCKGKANRLPGDA